MLQDFEISFSHCFPGLVHWSRCIENLTMSVMWETIVVITSSIKSKYLKVTSLKNLLKKLKKKKTTTTTTTIYKRLNSTARKIKHEIT